MKAPTLTFVVDEFAHGDMLEKLSSVAPECQVSGAFCGDAAVVGGLPLPLFKAVSSPFSFSCNTCGAYLPLRAAQLPFSGSRK